MKQVPILALVVVFTLAAAAWLVAFACGYVEIGVVGEWTWNRHNTVAAIDVAIPIVIACVVIAAYLWTVRTLARKVDGSNGLAKVVVPFVALLGFFVLWSVQSCAPSPHRQLKPNWVLYHWGASGYFEDARELESLNQYLASYEEEMAKGEVLHKGTHPPGLVMANYGLVKLCRDNENIATAIQATIPGSVAKAFGDEVPKFRLPENERAALWLSILITQLLAAFTLVPLYGLLRRTLDADRSLLLASLWPLVPGVAVFLPKSDALYPIIGCTFLFFALAAWDKGSWWRATIAGVTFWLGMMLSLAMLPFAVITAMQALIRYRDARPNRRGMTASIAGTIGSFAMMTLLFHQLTGVALWRTWLMNYQNHASFYEQFERSYTKWLVMNPLELVLTLGAPILMAALLGAFTAIRSRNKTAIATSAAVFGTWLLLFLSGKNLGEAARLWVLLTPTFVWACSSILAEHEQGAHRTWLVLAMCQASIAVLTTYVVNGFSPPL